MEVPDSGMRLMRSFLHKWSTFHTCFSLYFIQFLDQATILNLSFGMYYYMDNWELKEVGR